MTMRMLYTPVCLAILYIYLSTGFIIENHIKPTPYTISTNYCPSRLATSTIFVKSETILLQIRYKDRLSLAASRSTITLYHDINNHYVNNALANINCIMKKALRNVEAIIFL